MRRICSLSTRACHPLHSIGTEHHHSRFAERIQIRIKSFYVIRLHLPHPSPTPLSVIEILERHLLSFPHASDHLPQRVPGISAHQYRNRPLLPLPVPVCLLLATCGIAKERRNIPSGIGMAPAQAPTHVPSAPMMASSISPESARTSLHFAASHPRVKVSG